MGHWFILISLLMLTPQSGQAFRRKTIKEHTKNVTDFNIKQLFPVDWVDSIQRQCQRVFNDQLFQCNNNVFINVLTPQKRHRLTTTPEGGFIFAYATFAFVYQMKKMCIENDLVFNCGCNVCTTNYPSTVCSKLVARKSDAFGGCDPKSRHALFILDQFMESYLQEVQMYDEELALLIYRNMIVGRKEALRFVRKLVDIEKGEFCDCKAHYCPDESPLSCLKSFLYKQEAAVADHIFGIYLESVKAILNNDSKWVDTEGEVIREKNIIYTEEYEPDCEREVKGRTCQDTSFEGVTFTQSSMSSHLMSSLSCAELCDYCGLHQNYTVHTVIEKTDCNCQMNTREMKLQCEYCDIVVHKCGPSD